jgi:hypothetical protein
MNAWESLPVEILDLIFDIIADHSIIFGNEFYQCQLTCKNWCKVAQARLYKSITIWDYGQFINLLETLCSSESNLTQYVENIVIKYSGRSAGELLQILLIKCPNIKTLKGNLKITNMVFFKAILQASHEGSCKRLQHVMVPRFFSISDQQLYLDTMYNLRNSLRYLFLDESYMPQPNDPIHSQLQVLNKLPNLRTIKIKINSMQTFRRLGKYTKNCNNLEKMELFWRLRIDTNKNMAPEVHSIATYPTVKHLHLTHIHITKQMLEYFIHEFPNLNVLIIDQPTVSTGTYNIIPSSLWVQFLVFLQNTTRKVLIKQLYIVDILDTIIDYLNMSKPNVHLYVTLDSLVKKLYANIENERKQSGDLDISIKLTVQLIPSKSKPSLVTLLRRIGSILKSLIVNRIGFYDVKQLTPNGSVWDIICRQCSSLERLRLNSLTVFTYNISQFQTNSSIKDVTINKCNLSEEFFPYLSIQLPSLSHLSLIRCNLTSNNQYNYAYRNIVIKMPHTTFDTLTWVTDLIIRDSTFNSIALKVDTLERSYYYMYNENNIAIELSSASFKKSCRTAALCFNLQCQGIKKLKLIHNNYLWKIVFT